MLAKAPDSWPEFVVAVVAMVLLAVLDLAGAFAAKEAVLRQSPVMAAVGMVCFLLLFYVYASSLQYAELAPVTLGWVVVLQVGVVLLDRFRYGTAMPTGVWITIGVILVAQASLILQTSSQHVAGGS